ncbi:MAG: hypothetical protein WD749_11565 [Phycisphaerales bacterium]
MARRTISRARAVVAAAALALLAACVAEKPRRTGLRHAPAPAPAELPAGPIAKPAPPGATTSSRIQVQIGSLDGEHGIRRTWVRYDGQVLPIVSPDGRYLAVQDGEPPTWPTLLAEMAAEPPANTTLAAYDLTQAPARRIDWPGVEGGLLLGRSADTRGFLVESPRPDGSRWIGRVSWASGQVQWLVQGDAVNAHAVLTADGSLLFTRRGRLDERADLVLRTPGGVEIAREPDEGTYAFPLAGPDPEVVYVLRLTPRATEIEAVRVLTDAGRPPRFGSAFSRGMIAAGGELVVAYQATAPVQGPLPAPPRTSQADPGTPRPGAGEPQPVFYPLQGRMALFDVRSGGFALLPHQSIAAVRWDADGATGYLCTTPEGLVFAPRPRMPGDRGDRTPPRDIRIAATPYVPRITSDPDRPVVLFGPAGRDPRMLEVLLMRQSPVDAMP